MANIYTVFYEKHEEISFQKDAYISVDFFKKKYEVIQMEDTENPDPFAPVIDLGDKGKKQINVVSENPWNTMQLKKAWLIHQFYSKQF